MTGRRILVVEDNPLNQKLVRDVLTASGYQVLVAGTGEEGVRLAAAEAPDLILMDIQLPGIDGYEALRLLRQMPQLAGLPVVAVTAFAMPEDRERATREGFDGYLGKPISVSALPSQVDEFLSGRGADVS
ncbi:response regulator [Microbacterium deminutum]|uniref:Response regulatory domain-containing protein n=1 Tax=Microbacterium deminutum TaxID=344164 RepID=A0ABN2QQY2_9MICO